MPDFYEVYTTPTLIDVFTYQEKFITESNAIENIITVDDTDPLRYQHFDAFAMTFEQLHTTPDVELWHKLLLKALLPNAGFYRSFSVRVGNYLAPDSLLVPIYMERLLKAIENKPPQTEEDCWAYHFWFETIHPFEDGNGRVGRLLLAYLYVKYLQKIPIVLNSNKTAYYDAIEDWRKNNLKWRNYGA